MSAINKIPRGLRVLIVVAILVVLVARFATGNYFYPAIGAAVLITIGVIYVVYRKPRAASDKAGPKISKAAEEDKTSVVSAENLEAADAVAESIPVEEDYTDSPAGLRLKPETAFRNVTMKPKATDVAARYMQMAKMAETAEGPSIAKPAEAVDEKTAEHEDTAPAEPPMPLIEDETTLTEEDKHQLVNAVWYRCENPYCKYTRFLSVHHILEEKDGGTNKLDNLVVLCPFCHDLAHKNEIPEKEMRDWIGNREERFKFKPEWPYH